MKRSILASVIAASLLSAAPTNAEPLIAAVDLPGIPLSVTDPVRKTSPASSSSRSTEQQKARAQTRPSVNSGQLNEEIRKLQAEMLAPSSRERGNAAEPDQSDQESYIVAEPGVNEILQISRGHPNRILLPFENPKIQTTAADAQIKAEGSVVFVATNSQRPVTLFVSPNDNPRLALSLTLVPGPRPPSQYEVRLSENGSTVPAGGYFMGNAAAEQWEKKDNYTQALVNLFGELAKENLPQGYKLRNPSPGRDLGTCYSGGQVDYKMAQVVEGHHLVVQILVAKNTGTGPVEVIGSHCAAEGVVAAAEWPNSVLEPGEKTEMFVAFERKAAAKQSTRRPSAIGGQ